MSTEHWSIRVYRNHKLEDVGTLPRSVSHKNVKEALRALAARELKPNEVLSCAYDKRFKCRSDLLDVQRLASANMKCIFFAIDWGGGWSFEATLEIRLPK